MAFSCGLCEYKSISNLATQLHVQNEHPQQRNNHVEFVKKISSQVYFGETENV